MKQLDVFRNFQVRNQFLLSIDTGLWYARVVFVRDALREARLRVQNSRKNYKQEKENRDSDTIVYTVDMQKVIMLPRMSDVKDSFFLYRLILFNESFVFLKPKDKHLMVIWYEAIAARNVEDVSCAFLTFMKKHRDVKNNSVA
ncbi:unnamed protein product [Psylliodes chrysocephalus]|uniref:Uncharacterized protein n=1 Tax=Psylliodes chrysocephalus TaxID=3402493 RepID=A0A9P0D3J9_9CUCU|nr:unnamed protein product [Psylliodes chrysocephala]